MTRAPELILHDVAIADELYHLLYYLARIDQRRIRTILARAIEEYGARHGVYVTTKGGMLEVCPLCKRDLSEKTVAGYLLKRGVWVCAPCHKQLVRERDTWLRAQRPKPAPAPARRTEPPTMREPTRPARPRR